MYHRTEFECGIGNAECGKKYMEFGIGTRRRPIGRDYAAAKDAEGGIFRFRIADCGLRPVGAIGACAPEGMLKQRAERIGIM